MEQNQSSSYTLGRAIGLHWQWVIIIGLACAVGLFIYTGKQQSENIAAPQAIAQPDPRAECEAGMESLTILAEQAAKTKDPQEVVRTLSPCSQFALPPRAQALYDKAYTEATQQEAKRSKEAYLREKARKKREGVSIGMSEQDVLDSSWGKPDHVNTTHNAYGKSAQWVYRSGSYLYFKDGTLTSIQN